jgi:hypothetical protein
MADIEIYFDEFLSSQKSTYNYLSEKFQNDIEKFHRFFDLQQRLFYNHLPGVSDPYYQLQEYERIVIQSYIKTTHLIFSVHELILHGDYGTARILMRQIFEYLILGKYVHTKKNNGIAEKWLDDKQFDVYDKIIRLLKKPDKKNFFEFWKLLSNQTHAGTNSFQIGVSPELTYEDILVTYRMNLIFLCCKNRLLNSNFINDRLKYRSEKYGFKKSENQVIKNQLKMTEKEILELFSDSGIDVINDYKSKWEFKK